MGELSTQNSASAARSSIPVYLKVPEHLLLILLSPHLQLTNLMAPNCPSLTHVTFAALRVEPVLWRFGQAAGTAVQVALATHRGMALQDVNVTAVQDKLYEQGIVYHYPFRQYCDTPVPPPPPPPAPPKCKTLQVCFVESGPTKEKCITGNNRNSFHCTVTPPSPSLNCAI